MHIHFNSFPIAPKALSHEVFFSILSQVLPNLWAVHNDPDLWKEPEEFIPERHLDSNGNFVKSNYVIPFSLGPRHSLGEQLARMEVFIFLVSL